MADSSIIPSWNLRSATLAGRRPLLLAWSLCGVLWLNYLLRGGHDAQRMAELALLPMPLLALLLPRQSNLALALDRRMAALLAGLFVIGAVSSCFAFSPQLAFYETGSLFLLLLMALGIGGEIARGDNDDLMLVLELVGIGCLFYAFRVAVVYVSIFIVGAPPDIFAFAPGFSNYRFFNHAQTVALPLLVLLAAAGPQKRRGLWFALAALWWALLYTTGGRGSMYGLAAGAVALVLLRVRFARTFLRTFAGTALAGAVIYGVICHVIPALAGMQPFGAFSRVVTRWATDDPTSARTGLWLRALELMREHPLLGAGPIHFAHYSDTHQAAHPHDWVLQFGAEWGVPALLLLCAAVYLGLRALVAATRSLAAAEDSDARNREILSCWVLAGVAIVVDGLVSGVLVMPQSQLMIVLYIGCASGWYWRSYRPLNDKPGGRRPVLAAAAFLAVLAVANATLDDVGARLRGDQVDARLQAINGQVPWPRIWSLGHF